MGLTKNCFIKFTETIIDRTKLFYFFVLFFISINTTYSQIKVPIYVNESHPPYLYTTNGKPDGVYVDVLREIDKNMPDYVIDIKSVPWARAKKFIEVGEIFGFMPPYYHGHDWEYVWPYSIPVHEEKVVVVIRSDIAESKSLVNWPNDFIGLIVANNTGFDGFGGSEFRKLVKEGKITLEEAATVKQNILKVLNGRVDCYMVNKGSLEWEVKQIDNPQSYSYSIVVGPTIQSNYVYLGITDRDNGKFDYKRDFLQKFNNEVYKMLSNGYVHKLYKKHLE